MIIGARAPHLAKSIRLKAEDVAEDGTFTGYGSVFNVEDRGSDIVMPGAFKASLAEHKRNGTTPKLLWQHDPGEPIGIWLEMKEDSRGLWCRGQLLTEFERGRQAHVLMKRGALDGLSIGYDCRVWEMDESVETAGVGPYGGPIPMGGYCANGIRRLKEIDLWEVSIVTFPMCVEARVETVKRGSDTGSDGSSVPAFGRTGLTPGNRQLAIGNRPTLSIELADLKRAFAVRGQALARKDDTSGLRRRAEEAAAAGDIDALQGLLDEANSYGDADLVSYIGTQLRLARWGGGGRA